MNSRLNATLEATAQPTFDDTGADEVATHSAGGCDPIAAEKRSTRRAHGRSVVVGVTMYACRVADRPTGVRSKRQ
jgi:hypothetical protein